MACSGYTKVWDLNAGELMGLDGARGTTLRVTRGVVWMTFENDPRDVVLGVGDVFTIDRGGLTLMEAQENTTVCVLAHQVEMVRLGGAHPTWWQRVSEWIEDVAEASLRRPWAPHV